MIKEKKNGITSSEVGTMERYFTSSEKTIFATRWKHASFNSVYLCAVKFYTPRDYLQFWRFCDCGSGF